MIRVSLTYHGTRRLMQHQRTWITKHLEVSKQVREVLINCPLSSNTCPCRSKSIIAMGNGVTKGQAMARFRASCIVHLGSVGSVTRPGGVGIKVGTCSFEKVSCTTDCKKSSGFSCRKRARPWSVLPCRVVLSMSHVERGAWM